MHPLTKVVGVRAKKILSLFAFIILSGVALPALATLSASITTCAGLNTNPCAVSNFPATVPAVGSSFDATLMIRNNSSSPEDADTIILTDIEWFPSCASISGSGTTCTPDLNTVFSIVVSPGIGEFDPPFTWEPNVCDAFNSGGLIVQTIPGGIKINTTNEVDIGTAGHSNLCLINLHLTVLALPAHDTNPNTAGIQTLQLACVHIEGFDLHGTANIPGPDPCVAATARPLFVIGDVEPHGVGTNVNFWGSQWWKNNVMSGLVTAGYPAFKGYATDADTFCGGVWETRPGNSSDPPDVIPDDVLVIVTTKVIKDGPNISGDILDILLVHSDGGYGPAPGHRGNGPVVTKLCGP